MCKIGQTWSCWRTTDFAFFYCTWSSHIWTSQILTGISLLTLRFLGTEICGSVSIWLKPAPLQPAWLRFMKKTSWEIPAAIFGHCQARTHPLASQKIWFALDQNVRKNSGWWFGTWILFFSYIGNSNPNWRIPSFFRGVGIPPTRKIGRFFTRSPPSIVRHFVRCSCAKVCHDGGCCPTGEVPGLDRKGVCT